MKDMDIRLLALDLDGTLMDSDKHFPEINCRALQACERRGIRVCLVSGRSFELMRGFARELGVSPMTSVPYVCARILGISVGTGTVVAYFVFLFLELCVYRKHFRPVYVLQIPAAFLFGWFTDVTMLIAGRIDHHGSLPIQLAMVIAGVIIVGLGLRLYLTAGIIAIPPDALAVSFA